MSRYYIGLDIGATNINVGIYSTETKEILEISKTPFRQFEKAQREIDINICKTIRKVIEKHKIEANQLEGIGIATASIFDRKSGDITNWPNNKLWNGFPLKSYLEKEFNTRVIMEDDANAAAIGEHLYGAGKNHSNLAYITISSGIGSGIILNDRIHIGSQGLAGEIGHIKVVENGPKCKCGAFGCLQSLASGRALYSQSLDISSKKGNVTQINSLEDCVKEAIKGERWAKDIFERAGKHIGNMMISLTMTLDLSLIIIGGGVLNAGELIINPIVKTTTEHLEFLNRKIEIKENYLGDNSGVIGAISLIYNVVNDGSKMDIKNQSTLYRGNS